MSLLHVLPLAEWPQRQNAPAHAEAALMGAHSPKKVCRAAAALDQDFAPISDMRASADYRLQVARNLILKYGMDCAGDPVPRLAGYDSPLVGALAGVQNEGRRFHLWSGCFR